MVPAGVRVEDMPKPAEQSEESDGPGSGASQHKSDNATVLRSLFNGADGVKGAISHDRIMEGKAVDRVIVRQRAEQIAEIPVAQINEEVVQVPETRSRSSSRRPKLCPGRRPGARNSVQVVVQAPN